MKSVSKEWTSKRGAFPGLALLAALCFSAPVAGMDVGREEVDGFISRMVDRHQFDRAELEKLFAQVEVRQPILDAIARPAERVKPWHEYRRIFVTEKRIDRGVEFWKANQDSVHQTAKQFGVSPEVVVAVVGVETAYGRITGSYRVIDALSTLAFDYPPRAPFFKRELEHFLLLTREEDVDPLSATGSYAGAMGLPQFMPSSFRSYAVDASEDGRKDIWSNWTDVLGSVANYMNVHGWITDDPVAVRVQISGKANRLDGTRIKLDDTVGSLRRKGVILDDSLQDERKALLIALDGDAGKEYWVGFKNYYVITRYNKSLMYAMAVHQLAGEIAARLDDEVT